MVPIHNKGDPKRPKGKSKTIGEYAHAHSQPSPSRWPRAIKKIGKTIEAAREA